MHFISELGHVSVMYMIFFPHNLILQSFKQHNMLYDTREVSEIQQSNYNTSSTKIIYFFTHMSDIKDSDEMMTIIMMMLKMPVTVTTTTST